MKKFLVVFISTLFICLLVGCGQVVEPWQNVQIPDYPEETAASAPPTSQETQPTEETHTGEKPSGLVLNPDMIPTAQPYNPADSSSDDVSSDETTANDTDTTTPEVIPTPDHPTQEITDSKLTQGLQNALNQFGHTTTDGINFVAYSPISGMNGEICIIHIASNSTAGIQNIYFYYEDTQSLELNSTLEVMPVTDPNSVSYVMFDGYVIW